MRNYGSVFFRKYVDAYSGAMSASATLSPLWRPLRRKIAEDLDEVHFNFFYRQITTMQLFKQSSSNSLWLCILMFLATDATIYVGGLDEKVNDPILWELFLQAGPVGKLFSSILIFNFFVQSALWIPSFRFKVKAWNWEILWIKSKFGNLE